MILDPDLWRAREGLPALLASLGGEEDATRFVGGAVRDTLLGMPVADLDLATRLPPAETLARIAAAGFKAVPTGLAHGTVTAVLPSGPVEVTTLRRDVATDGRHAVVAFTDDWQEDAARRDFTINALFARATDGGVVDYFDGEADLAARRVRFIGDPLRRIAEDHLRILRFFRFHARFASGAPDAPGLAACTARANDLMALSRERIADELFKLLGVADPVPTLTLMTHHAILTPVLPEIGRAGIGRLAALVAAEAALGLDADPVRRLAALLDATPVLADAVGRRLKLSNARIARLAAASDPAADAQPLDALAYARGATGALDRLLLSGRADAAGVAHLAAWSRPLFAIGGGTLIKLGLAPGPIVARTLQAVERRWIEEGFPPPPRLTEIARAAVLETTDAA